MTPQYSRLLASSRAASRISLRDNTSCLVHSRSVASRAITTPRPKIPKEAVKQNARELIDAADEEPVPEPAGPLSDRDLSLLFSFTNPPPVSALYAFASRVSVNGQSLAADEHLPLVEQALIYGSFWEGVKYLGLGESVNVTNFNNEPRRHNGPLAILGNTLLGVFASELILKAFPNLPTFITQKATSLFVGPQALAAVATSWGIVPSRADIRLVGQDGRPDVLRRGGRKSKAARSYGHLVNGVGPRAPPAKHDDHVGGMGLVRWDRTNMGLSLEMALSASARAMVGAVYEVYGFAAARDFAHHHFLSRLISPEGSGSQTPLAADEILQLIKFENPTTVLYQTLKQYNLDPLQHKLLKESGRLSSNAMFLTGAFSGDTKIGEGFGSSIKMSKWRASEDSLRRFFLARPSDSSRELPSDTWADSATFAGLDLGEAEIKHESASK